MEVPKQLVFLVCLATLSFSSIAQNKYALLIGINDYYEVKGVKSEVSLRGSVNDANAIRNLLITKFGFAVANVDTIYNGEATRDNIIAGLKKKLKQCKPGDAMVFYYSGHGVYMYNSEEKKDSVKRGMNQAMLTSDLYNYDDHLKCFLRDFTLKQYFNLFVNKKVILTALFDCCFSGKLAMATPGQDLREQVKSIDLQDLFGRLTENANNPQLLIDSITGRSTQITTGCATDSTGKINNTLDSDGDGVPDCRDREKLTPRQCFPVNQDGVGNCPYDYVLNTFRETVSRYDSAEFKNANATETSLIGAKAFSAEAVLNISEKDTIARPVDRKNSRFLFISATTDAQKAFEFPDEKGVMHSFFTASIIRVFNKNPAGISVETLFQKINEDMNSFHRNQNPTLYCDPIRRKDNLPGVMLKNAAH